MSNEYFNHDNPLTRHTLGRAEQVNSIFDAVAAGFDKLADPDAINQGRATYVQDTGAADAYVVALDKAPEAYVAGLSFVMKADNANTGASTVNVNGLGVKAIKRYDGTPLVGGDILPGMLVLLGYDGTDFKIIGAHGAESALAKDWANKTSGNVDGSEFSSKEYAQGSQASTGGSSKNWAQQSGAVTGAGANDRSSKSWAQSGLTGATLGGSAKDWAQHTGSAVDGTGHSAKAHAESEGQIAAGSAKEWATKTTEVADSLKGARGYAQDASNSADAAATSEANAEGHYDTFRGIFYGALSEDPTLDPNGDPLDAGDWYFNTTTDNSRIYDGSAWADIGSAANLNNFVFTATGGETSLSGQDDNGNTLAYTAGLLMVHKNGALLTPDDDYTASNGTSITGLSALTTGDVVVIDAFTPFDAADVLERSNNLSDLTDAATARTNLNVPSLAGGADANYTAMPQVGGDPIVESGSNADGEWTRWADGTQISRVKRVTIPFNAASNCLGTWTFPAGFLNDNISYRGTLTPIDDATPATGFASDATPASTTGFNFSVAQPTTTTVQVAVIRTSATDFVAGDNMYASMEASGFWK